MLTNRLRNCVHLPLLAALAIAGCSVGPHYKAPQPAPAQFHSADAQLDRHRAVRRKMVEAVRRSRSQ